MNLPKTWDDISIDQYSRLYPFLKEKAQSNEEEVRLNYKRIVSVMDCEIEEVDKLTIREVKEFNKLITSPMPNKINKRLKVNGKKFRINLNPNELKAGSLISLLTDLQDKPYKTLHKIIYNISEPIKLTPLGYKKYKLKESEISETIEAFKHLPMSVANPIIVFFYHLSNDLKKVTEEYLLTKSKEMNKTLQEIKADLQS